MRVVLGFTFFDVDKPQEKPEGKELEKIVDDDIDRFQTFMMDRVDDSGPLMAPERSILKTYLWWKAHNSPMPEEKTDA